MPKLQNINLSTEVKVRPMEVEPPVPAVVRHTRRFYKAEIIQALRFWMEQHGCEVPVGNCYLNGLDDSQGSGEPSLFMVIEKTVK